MGTVQMDLIVNPSQPDLLALNINDSIKFLHLTFQQPKNDVLTREDFTSTSAPLPKLPQHVDSYNVSCMTWCGSGGSATANTVTLGLTSGKVVSLWPGTEKNHPTANGLIYQAPKACTALSWNRAQPSLLAMGMERSRSENSLLIWDLTSGHISERGNAKISDAQKLTHRPQYETCFAEVVNSVMWTKNDSKTLIAGVAAKNLRMYDLRNIRSASITVPTRAVFGICQDTCLDTRFASYFENQLYIWDLRNFSKPAAVISAKFNILKAEWCPTRKGLLATVSGGSSDGCVIRVYDMAHAMLTDSDPDIAYRHVEQIVKLNLNTDETVGTFAWMEEQKNQLIAVTNTGTLHCVNVPERISLGWTNNSILMSACKQHYQCCDFQNPSSDKGASPQCGIEHIMYKRAVNGYGLRDNIIHHDSKINLEPDNKTLSAFWKWIKLAKESLPVEISQDNKITTINPRALKTSWNMNSSSKALLNSRFSGLLFELSKQTASTGESVSWVGVPNVQCTVYSSPQRTRALKMCGWSPTQDLRENDTEFRRQLLGCDNIERAATVALWHLDMRLAIDLLQQNMGPNASKADCDRAELIAMALSGYPGSSASSLWRVMCGNLQKSIPSPYLRAAFAFLNAQGNGKGTYKEILKAKDISNMDRVGFACMFLADDALLEVLETLSETAAKSGDLEGVIATGLTTDRGIELMQSYVDITKDVQTAALSFIQTGCNEILKSKSACHMIEGYKNLLNTWMLWKERASVDNAIGKMSGGLRTKQSSQSVFVQCNYCGKTIRHSARMQNIRGRGILALQGHGMTNKATSCPSCRKPLPRCSVCCMYLGTSPTDFYEKGDTHGNDLDCWFTWCPLCQHGGHTSHLTTWFKEHIECPLSGCMCKCWNVKELS